VSREILDLEAALGGNRRALARALTAVENETEAGLALLAALDGRLGRARVVGLTGPPGAGKSTLVGACLGELLERDLRVAVVAVDPSSPYSGGAILGDRLRMDRHAADERVFIRSLAARGHLGGLSRSTAWVVDLLDAAGFDVVIVETVGTGQSETEIVDLAQVRVVLCAPGLGDDVQALKSGILEIADLLVVNKADLPGASETLNQLRSLAAPADGGPARDPERRLRHVIARLAAEQARTRLQSGDDPGIAALCTAVRRGELGLEAAARRALGALGK
jgi:LAO/AO transport system ATPase